MSVLLDAGPVLNFLAVGQQNVLIQAADHVGLQMCAPQRIDIEVLGMAKDPLFAETAVASTWRKLTASGRIRILSDELNTSGFTAAVTRISGVAAPTRVRSRRSLGEIMVLAHASVFAQRGTNVIVLIDEQDGRDRAAREQGWLRRNSGPGQLALWSTKQVLKQAQPAGIVGGLSWEQAARRAGLTRLLRELQRRQVDGVVFENRQEHRDRLDRAHILHASRAGNVFSTRSATR